MRPGCTTSHVSGAHARALGLGLPHSRNRRGGPGMRRGGPGSGPRVPSVLGKSALGSGQGCPGSRASVPWVLGNSPLGIRRVVARYTPTEDSVPLEWRPPHTDVPLGSGRVFTRSRPRTTRYTSTTSRYRSRRRLRPPGETTAPPGRTTAPARARTVRGSSLCSYRRSGLLVPLIARAGVLTGRLGVGQRPIRP